MSVGVGSLSVEEFIFSDDAGSVARGSIERMWEAVEEEK